MTIDHRPAAAALGVFDGVHLGHRSVMERAAGFGFCRAVTFQAETMPQKHGCPLRFIYGDEQRIRLLKQCGADSVTVLPFDEISGMDGESFCRELLVNCLHVSCVVCGVDFRFGKGASCGTKELASFGEKLGFRTETVPQVLDPNGLSVSSSRIRSMLESGNLRAANRLLGQDYEICTKVVSGRQEGRTLGAPTANQLFAGWQCIPKFGVYASFAEIDGVRIPSITSIGVRPTLTDGNGEPVAETHLIGWQGYLTGTVLPVTLTDYLRGEQRFDSKAALIRQIRDDIRKRTELLSAGK